VLCDATKNVSGAVGQRSDWAGDPTITDVFAQRWPSSHEEWTAADTFVLVVQVSQSQSAALRM